MEMRLVRKEISDTATIGELTLDDKYECFTLEDPVREIDGQPPAVWKVKDETAIPRGRYEVVITFSDRFKRLLPLLLNVPGFTGIRIHYGNTPHDTSGCILVGSIKQTDRIAGSRLAFDALFPKLQASCNSGKVWIEIT